MSADLHAQIQEIYDRRGRLTPADVVDEARDEQHPLHHRFEWDDARASESYRLMQAQRLIRAVRVVVRPADPDSPTVRAYHSVQEPNGRVYRPVEDLANDEITTAIVLRDMERDWRLMLRRYERFRDYLAELVHKDLGDAA